MNQKLSMNRLGPDGPLTPDGLSVRATRSRPVPPDRALLVARLTFGDALRLSWARYGKRVVLALVASLTLGLAPFYPHAHIWKQLVNLANGTLVAPIDVFDLVLHGAPWVALIVTVTHLLVSAALLVRARRMIS